MGLRVLVAEDEALVALSLADLLQADGHEVVLAHDGADALVKAMATAAEGRPPDAVVTELRMPRLSGEELIRALRAEWPDLPVVVVAGSAPQGSEAELLRLCGGGRTLVLLRKPLAYALLAEALLDTVVPAFT